MKRDKGFTLLEVMVALGVLAIAVSSLFLGMVQYNRNAGYLKQTTIAGWVARNLVTEYQLIQPTPRPDDKRGTMELADHEWYWRLKVSDLPENPAQRRIDVEVRLEEDDPSPLVDYVGFMEKK
ncbi:MAG: type II secretion system minor pseudopilin GspI [Gammaproteobacteria bacterium]|nr:type II secretion system minor pseudopilin GspI [Gammaproteobacteria bacterium]